MQTCVLVHSEVTRQPGHSGYINGSQSCGVCVHVHVGEWGIMLRSMETCYVCFAVSLWKCKLHLVCSVHWATLPNEVFHFVKVSFGSCA